MSSVHSCYNPAVMEETATTSRRRVRIVLGLLVSAACLASVLFFVRPADIVSAAADARVDYLFLTALSLLAFLIIRAIRWRFMLQGGQEVQRIVSYKPVFHIQNIGYLLNNLMPFRLGDIARAVLIGKTRAVSTSTGLSTMVVERALDLLLMAILFPLSLSAIGQVPSEIRGAAQFAGLAAAAALLVLLLVANQPTRARALTRSILGRLPLRDTDPWLQRADDLLLGLETLSGLRDGLTLLLLSVAVWVPIVLGYWTGMRAVGISGDLIEATMVVTVAAFSVTAPSSPGQVGVFEAGVTFALATVLGYADASAAAFAILYHLTNYLVIALLGVAGILSTGTTLRSVVESARAFGRASTG